MTNRTKRGCIQKFPDCCLERELRMAQLSATRCSCIAIFLPQHYTASQPRRWRQHGWLLKRWYPTTIHGVTTQS